MIPEIVVVVLACARIGAVHNVVFGGFSSESIAERVNDCHCKLIITQDQGVRGEKYSIPMFENSWETIEKCPSLEKIIVVTRSGDSTIKSKIEGDNKCVYYESELEKANDDCPCEEMDSEDPLFILYTSGSTGKPKGMYHTTGGYLSYAAQTQRLCFDTERGDVHQCTADVGWITGHTYIVQGPMSQGANIQMFEGVPTYPHPGVLWELIERNKTRSFYTAPTLLRSLMKIGNEPVTKYDRSSVKILGTVGETIKAPEWIWYNNVIGENNCHVIDTQWQTETGGIMVAPLPFVNDLKPGSAMYPIPGVKLAILDINTNEKLEGNDIQGKLCIEPGWPGQARGVWGDKARFFSVYFESTPGYQFAGDGCYKDEDGHIWVTGRIDDIIITAGHNLSSVELELNAQKYRNVVEAAVVGVPDDIKGQAIVIFIVMTLNSDEDPESVKKGVTDLIRKNIGPIATPKCIRVVSDLPKTRSGKIMRRILRKIECGEHDSIGDVSTLSNPDCVQKIIEELGQN